MCKAATGVGLKDLMSGVRAPMLGLLPMPIPLLEFATATAAVADEAALLKSSRALSTSALLPATRFVLSRDCEDASALLPDTRSKLPTELLRSLDVEGRGALQRCIKIRQSMIETSSQ